MQLKFIGMAALALVAGFLAAEYVSWQEGRSHLRLHEYAFAGDVNAVRELLLGGGQHSSSAAAAAATDNRSNTHQGKFSTVLFFSARALLSSTSRHNSQSNRAT